MRAKAELVALFGECVLLLLTDEPEHNVLCLLRGQPNLLADFFNLFFGRIQIRSATPIDSMNEGGMLRAVDQQLSVHSQW